MIVYEKMRAICQQLEDYQDIVPTHRTPRARDFFDIYIICEHFSLELTKKENLEILKEIFKIKEVPLEYLNKIGDTRDFHRDDFSSVKDTVSPEVKLKSYDFYFDFVLEKAEKISKALGII